MVKIYISIRARAITHAIKGGKVDDQIIFPLVRMLYKISPNLNSMSKPAKHITQEGLPSEIISLMNKNDESILKQCLLELMGRNITLQ